MRRSILATAAALMGILSASVMAGDFYHPFAVKVLTTGGDAIEICEYNRDYPEPKWNCYPHNFPGTPDKPFIHELNGPGPVLVKGAFTAWATPVCLDSGGSFSGTYDGGYFGGYAGVYAGLVKELGYNWDKNGNAYGWSKPSVSVEVGVEGGVEGGVQSGTFYGTGGGSACPGWEPMTPYLVHDEG